MGTISWLSGRILSASGSPLRNAVMEIWQADNAGNYIHSRGALTGARDANFQGYGKFETGSDGRYLFRTIKPSIFPGRVRHVHVKVTLPGGQSLTSQLYIEGETGNDGVLNGITNAAQRAWVIRPWTAISGSSANTRAVNWDVVMNFTPAETATPARPTLVSMAGVTNGASLRAGAASGSWITLYGAGLTPTTRTWRESEIAGGKLPESLDGVSVRINNQPSAVYYISPTQINVLAPETTAATTTAQVTVTSNNLTSDPVTVQFKQFDPAFFQFPDQNVAAVRTDGAYVGPAGLIDGVPTVSARPGETVLLFGTGFGPTAAAPPAATVNAVKIRIDGQEAAVTYAGLISPPLYQFNVTVPVSLGDGDYPIAAEVAGVRTAKIVKLRVARTSSAAAIMPSTHRKVNSHQLLRLVTA
ncbi:MAG: hypothetical protein FJW31_11365 [Acidobacteria bacterium]|nr:hypothetical protein [Acidobacteriota bacterium]